MIATHNQHNENVSESTPEKNRNNVISALKRLGYKVALGVNKDISDPNYSGIIEKRKRA